MLTLNSCNNRGGYQRGWILAFMLKRLNHNWFSYLGTFPFFLSTRMSKTCDEIFSLLMHFNLHFLFTSFFFFLLYSCCFNYYLDIFIDPHFSCFDFFFFSPPLFSVSSRSVVNIVKYSILTVLYMIRQTTTGTPYQKYSKIVLFYSSFYF